ncbi:MAG: rhodanese-like domain-containing protein [Thermoplasmata archaeon]
MKIIRGSEEMERVSNFLADHSNVFVDLDDLKTYEKLHPPFSARIAVNRISSLPLNIERKKIALFASDENTVDIVTGMGLQSRIEFLYDNSDGSWQRFYPYSYYRSISVADLYRDLKKYTVLDVREPFEMIIGTLPDSINIPMSDLEKNSRNLEIDKEYAVICAHGNRSYVAVEFLSSLGFSVYDVEGGINAWIEESLPLIYDESDVD